ncbi:RNA polymerase subunit sigma [Rathayibacter sp. AY1E4]|uniref:sigma-70 family RNA polymerase sigma factor n=1 Tax=unclassified Rathayibacter TaxID=2609250 RepID=UPI000CE8BEBC|nr:MULTISPECIES: sigma-70 family RNA polymerase sigma factor [unclassified Rathayibacter]PPG55442.1 RNA polymerase subunit sigma [Rathayibacter sp. AY1C5]PPG94784.1 RNA polymerase subunit sigma [Rathayibacter sp. AY1G9]PPH38528.1 RNA polymerase subunit sigma [Rathayibacter sp. AY1E4]PPH96808.1 RNA polymerase subunit sigma [Rathayibacter sp. AY1D1]PPI26979.1 RNA polymerase subunit sigma [Rathayibacter sp. AY1B5]
MKDDVEAAVRLLIARIAEGDTRAFSDLHDLIARDVYRVIRGVLRDPEQSREVTQEVFLEVWQRAATFDPAQASGHLLMRMARRRAIDRVRSAEASRQRDHEYAALSTEPEADVEARAQVRLDYAAAVAAIRALPLIHHEILFLAYVQGFSHTEIAHALQLPLGTVKTRIRDSGQRLRRILGADTVL